jgi:transglutaminase-like putative cysteine protease
MSWSGPQTIRQGMQAEGVRYLLYERQEHPERQERFTRLAVLLENESGVQDEGTLSFQFDPDYQELWLHAVRVHRSGEVMDRLDLTKLKLSQPEPELGAHIYTGKQTALLFVEDLRVGDVLEYAYTLRGRNPVLGEHYSARIRIQSGVPVERQRIRVVWSRPGKLRVRSPLPDPVQAPKAGAEGVDYQWDFTNLPPITVEDWLPNGFEPFPHLEFSDYGSWGEVVAWALPLYRTGEAAIPPGLRALADEWQAGLATDEERVLAALQFVQDEIRYTGIEIGPDSYRPSQPTKTFEQRFGDCKDKALLFCAILREWGIEAYPALVNSGRGEAVADGLPTPYAFDHVIVKIRFRETAFWVDPTLSHQGGTLEERHLPPVGKALVVREGVDGLEDVPARGGREADQVVTSRFRVTDYDAPVSLSVRTVFHAGEADRMRESLTRVGLPELAEDYRNFYARYYPKISGAAPLEIADDRRQNALTVVEQYRIEEIWTLDESSGRWQAHFYPESMMDVLTDPATRLRKMPLRVAYPLRREQELIVDLPDNDWTFPGLDEEVRHDTFQFRYRRVAEGSQVRFSYEIETFAGEVPPALVASTSSGLGR